MYYLLICMLCRFNNINYLKFLFNMYLILNILLFLFSLLINNLNNKVKYILEIQLKIKTKNFVFYLL